MEPQIVLTDTEANFKVFISCIAISYLNFQFLTILILIIDWFYLYFELNNYRFLRIKYAKFNGFCLHFHILSEPSKFFLQYLYYLEKLLINLLFA